MAEAMTPKTSTGKGSNSSTTDFTWAIKNFSRLNSNSWHFSDEIVAGGYKWQLCMQPRRTNRDDDLSLFLGMSDYAKLPSGWSVNVDFSLKLVNQVRRKHSINKRIQRQFRAGEVGCCIQNVVCLTELNDPSKGYLVNDAVIFETRMFLPNLDSKKEIDAKLRIPLMPTTSSTHGSVSLASSSSTLLDTSNNLLKKLSSLKKTQNSTSTSSSEILQDLQRKRKALKEYLGLSLEAIDEANAFAEIERIALLLLQHSASSLERAILKHLVSSLAAFKEIVPATNSRMENVRARMLYLSWKKADVRTRLCQGQEQLSSLEVRFSKLIEEEWELEMQVWDMLLTTRDELSITKKSVSLKLEMINEKVAADLEDLREISEEDELVANDWIQAREKLAQANLNWQLFKQNLELCEESV